MKAFCTVLCLIGLLAPLRARVAGQAGVSTRVSLGSWIQQAQRAQAAGQWQTAETAWRHVVRLSPSAPAWGNLGNVLKHEGKSREAIHAFHEGLKLAPRLSGLQLDLALVYYTGRQFAQAIPPLQAFVRQNPSNRQGLELLGICELNTRAFALAAVHLEKARQLSPTPDVALLYALASAQTMAGETAAAHQTLTQMLELGADSAPLHLLLGEAEFNIAHNQQALAEFDKALQLDPRLPSVHYQIGLVRLKQRNYPAAVNAFAEELKLRPDCPECYLQRGASEFMEHQDTAASSDIAASLRLNPHDHDAWYYRARLELRKGEKEPAVASLRRAIAVNDREPSSHYLLGRTLLALGKRAEAQQQFAIADKLHQQSDQRNDRAFRKDFQQVLHQTAIPVHH